MDLDVVFLGTGGSVPSARRATACVLVRAGGERLLFDCGEGAQRQMQRSTGLVQVDEIYLTHYHADHYLGVPGLLKTYDLNDREAPLRILGPPGPERPVRRAAADHRQGALPARAGRARRGRRGAPRRLRGPPVRGRAPSPGLRLRVRRGRAPGPLRPRRGERLGVAAGPGLRAAPGGGDGRRRRRAGRARTGDGRGAQRPQGRDHRRHRALRDDPDRRARGGAAGPRRELRRRGARSGRARPATRRPARPRGWRARRAPRRSRSSTSPRATTSAPSSRRRARSSPSAFAPRDFDVVEIPFPERGEPRLIEGGARDKRQDDQVVEPIPAAED